MGELSDRRGGSSRRQFLELAGGIAATWAATSALAGCSRWRPDPASCSNNGPVIDVHCHFFNASDVPVRGFVEYVALGELREEFFPQTSGVQAKGLFNGLIAFLVEILSRHAVTAADETARLRQQRKTDALADAILEMDRRSKGIVIMRRGDDGVASDYDGLLELLAQEADVARPLDRSRVQSRSEAVALASGLQRQQGKLRRYIAFALLLLDDREAIAREYLRVFAPSGCVSLATPSFLDMEKWLGDSPRSSLRQQVEVMDLLQLEMAGTGLKVHSFLGFDPWRAAEGGESLKLVKEAILERGFVGVKLYPPMGFQAIGNGGLKFPGRPAPKGIDKALRELYGWCEANEVAIMAHAENSLGSNCGYGHRASPRWWAQVLAAYPGLRVNLAHFGSFDELINPGGFPSLPPRCAADAYDKEAWETIIGKTIRDDAREYLFADLSYLSELTGPGGGDVKRKIIGYLGQFREDYDPEVRHLLYGTDWTMIAKEPDNENYMARLAEQLSAAGFSPDQQQNIFWRNAARYLGLGRRGRTHDRLRSYCVNFGIDADWLSAFENT